MKTKTDFTILERAIATVEGFEGVYKTLQQNITLRGQSPSTLHNYTRQISLVSLHFNCLPEKITDDQLNGYLASLALSAKSPSRSAFKHAVFGLRYYFRLLGDSKRAIKLPSIKKDAKLPVILNRSELRALFAAPKLLKHRVLLTLIYSAGLRSKEVINLKIADIDFERKTIHIRRSKYNKDRIVPLSDNMAMMVNTCIQYGNLVLFFVLNYSKNLNCNSKRKISLRKNISRLLTNASLSLGWFTVNLRWVMPNRL